jgi:hypothetical protein
MGVLLGLGPCLGSHVLDLPIGQRRQADEDFPQVALRVKPTAAAGFDDQEMVVAYLGEFEMSS